MSYHKHKIFYKPNISDFLNDASSKISNFAVYPYNIKVIWLNLGIQNVKCHIWGEKLAKNYTFLRIQ